MTRRLFPQRLRFERESRVLFFAGEVKLEGSHIDPNAAAKLAEQGESKDAKEQLTPEQIQKRRVEEAVDAANAAIAGHNDFAAKLSPEMGTALRTELGAFMGTTIEGFDKNGVAGLNKQEFDAYKANAETKIDELFNSMGSQAAAAQEKAKTEATADAAKAETSAGNGDLKGKTLEQIEAELASGALTSVDTLAAIDLTSEEPAELQKQLATYQKNVQAVNAAQDAIQQRGTLVAAFHGKAAEQMKVMSDTAEAMSASAAVSAGAGVGAAIGVWGFGVGALVGAGVGAVGGAIAYGVGRGIAAANLYRQKKDIADRANAIVNAERSAVAAAREKAGAEGANLAKQGEQVNRAPEALRVKTEEKAAAETAKVAELAARTEQDKQETSDKVAELEKAIDGTAQTAEQLAAAEGEALRSQDPAQRERAEQIGEKKGEIADQRAQMDEARAALLGRVDDFGTFLGELASTDENVRLKAQADHARLDDLDVQLGGDVLVANVRTSQYQEGLAEQGKGLSELTAIEPEKFLSTDTWSKGFDGFARGATYLMKDTIAATLDGWSTSLKEIPVVGALGYGLDVVSGVVEGVGDMGAGIATMLGHPMQAANGLGKAFLTAEGWKEMGKGMISYDDFAKGNVGKGIGKLGLNVLMTATGIGAAANGARAASLAYVASNAAGRGILRASATAAWTGAKVTAAEFGTGIAKMPGEFLSTTGKTLSAIRNIGSGKLASLTRTVGSLTDDLAKAGDDLGQYGDLAEALGTNAEDLSKMSGKELAAAGLTDSTSVARFMRYRKALEKQSSIGKALKTAEAAKTLEHAGPGLSKLQSLGEELATHRVAGNASKAERVLEKMRRVVDDANYKAADAAGDIGHIIHNTDGFMVAVNKAGKVELLADAADLTRWIDDTAAFQGISPDVLRVKVAEKVLGRTEPFTNVEAEAVIAAHNEEGFGTLEDGGINREQLRQKVGAMKDVFTKEERRILMERGITGSPTKKAPPMLEVIDDGNGNVLDDVVQRADGAESSVNMAKDPTDLEFARVEALGLERGKSYNLQGESGWTYESLDDSGRLVFSKDGVSKTVNPNKLRTNTGRPLDAAPAAKASPARTPDSDFSPQRQPAELPVLEEGKIYKFSDDGLEWRLDSVNPDADRITFTRGAQKKTLNASEMRATLSTARRDASTVMRDVESLYVAEGQLDRYMPRGAPKWLSPDRFTAAVATMFEPEVWKAIGRDIAYSARRGYAKMRNRTVYKYAPEAKRAIVNMTKKGTASKLGVEAPSRSARAAVAIEKHGGGVTGWLKAQAELMRGTDPLYATYTTLRRSKKQLQKAIADTDAATAELAKNPTAARADQLRQKIAKLEDRQNTLRAEFDQAYDDLRPADADGPIDFVDPDAPKAPDAVPDVAPAVSVDPSSEPWTPARRRAEVGANPSLSADPSSFDPAIPLDVKVLPLDPADLSAWIEEAAVAKNVDPSVVRQKVAEAILGRDVTPDELAMIENAHAIEGFGMVKDGGITREAMREKIAAMSGGTLRKEEINALIRAGVTGTAEKVKMRMTSLSRKTPLPGVDERWAIAADLREGQWFAGIRSRLDVFLGRDHVAKHHNALVREAKQLDRVVDQIADIKAKLGTNPSRIRAKQLQDKLAPLEKTRDELRGTIAARRNDLLPEQAAPTMKPGQITIQNFVDRNGVTYPKGTSFKYLGPADDPFYARMEVLDGQNKGIIEVSADDLAKVQMPKAPPAPGSSGSVNAPTSAPSATANSAKAAPSSVPTLALPIGAKIQGRSLIDVRGVTRPPKDYKVIGLKASDKSIAVLEYPTLDPKNPVATIEVRVVDLNALPTPSAAPKPTPLRKPAPAPAPTVAAPSAPKKGPPPPPVNTPPSLASKAPPVPSMWKSGERLQGRSVLAADGTTLPPRDYEVLGVRSSNKNLLVLQYRDANVLRTVEVPVVEMNKIPRPKSTTTPPKP